MITSSCKGENEKKKKLCKYEHREIYRLGSSEDWCHIKTGGGKGEGVAGGHQFLIMATDAKEEKQKKMKKETKPD